MIYLDDITAGHSATDTLELLCQHLLVRGELLGEAICYVRGEPGQGLNADLIRPHLEAVGVEELREEKHLRGQLYQCVDLGMELLRVRDTLLESVNYDT